MKLTPIANSKFLAYAGISFLVLFILLLMVVDVNPPALYKLALAGVVLLVVETAVEALMKRVLLEKRLTFKKKLLTSAMVTIGTVLLVFVATSDLLLVPLTLLESLTLVAMSILVAVTVTNISRKFAKREN